MQAPCFILAWRTLKHVSHISLPSWERSHIPDPSRHNLSRWCSVSFPLGWDMLCSPSFFQVTVKNSTLHIQQSNRAAISVAFSNEWVVNRQVPMDEVPDQELEVTSSKLKPARTEVAQRPVYRWAWGDAPEMFVVFLVELWITYTYKWYSI